MLNTLRIAFLSFLVISVNNIQTYSQCNSLNQSEFEQMFLDITTDYINGFRITFDETQKERYIQGYLDEIEQIICFDELKKYQGQVHEINSQVLEDLAEEYKELTGKEMEIDQESYANERDAIIITNERGRIWTPEEKLFKYEYTFGDNSPLADELLNLEKGKDVSFSFQFDEELVRLALKVHLETTALIKRMNNDPITPPTFKINLSSIKLDQ